MLTMLRIPVNNRGVDTVNCFYRPFGIFTMQKDHVVRFIMLLDDDEIGVTGRQRRLSQHMWRFKAEPRRRETRPLILLVRSGKAIFS